MSQLTADTLFGLISALPDDQKAVLRDKLNQMLSKTPKVSKKKNDIYDIIGDIYRPENREQLVAEIMYNS